MDLSNVTWRKASRSHDDGDECIELALIGTSWRKASQSTAEGDNCIEISGAPSVVALRDSKAPDGPMLVVSRREFQHLAEVLKAR